MLAALRRAGWRIDHQTGGHAHLKHSQRPGIVTVPMHPARTLKPRVLKSILNQAGLTVSELTDLL
jgi:predicted RNA binding protein YcfA (HicA-like mRNA interferase family)